MSLEEAANILGVITAVIALVALLLALFRRWLLPRLIRRIVGDSLQDPNQPVVRTKLTWQDAAAGLELLAKDAEDFHPTAILGINRGGAIVGGFLAKRMRLPRVYLLDVEFSQVEEQWSKRVPDLQRILLVDDAIRSGRHMHAACEHLRGKYHPRELRRAVLLRLQTTHPEPDPCTSATLEYSPYFTFDGRVNFPWDH